MLVLLFTVNLILGGSHDEETQEEGKMKEGRQECVTETDTNEENIES